MEKFSEFWLKNKVAVVAGGSSGIGAATVRALAMHGAETVVLDIASGEVAPERFIHTDVTQPDEVEKAKDEVVKRYGHVDILVNSAGIQGRLFPLLEMPFEEWQRVIQTNLFGIFLCCRAFGRIMLKQGAGIIVNVASNRGIYGVANYSHYAASKGGVIALTLSLARELRSHGVRVHGINPSSTLTPLWESFHTEDDKQRLLAAGKLAAPEEIAGMILLLTRPEARLLVFIARPEDA